MFVCLPEYKIFVFIFNSVLDLVPFQEWTIHVNLKGGSAYFLNSIFHRHAKRSGATKHRFGRFAANAENQD